MPTTCEYIRDNILPSRDDTSNESGESGENDKFNDARLEVLVSKKTGKRQTSSELNLFRTSVLVNDNSNEDDPLSFIITNIIMGVVAVSIWGIGLFLHSK